jgi:hypothetical protein
VNRKDLLDLALNAVNGEREDTYGGPEDSFFLIAKYWSAHLGTLVSTTDVAICLALLKIARLKGNPLHTDSWVDLAGYAACGAEVATRRASTEDK